MARGGSGDDEDDNIDEVDYVDDDNIDEEDDVEDDMDY